MFTVAGGDLDSLEWYLDSERILSSLSQTRNGEVTSQLEVTLEEKHANAALTCRLTTHAKNSTRKLASIRDVTTTILMFCKY